MRYRPGASGKWTFLCHPGPTKDSSIRCCYQPTRQVRWLRSELSMARRSLFHSCSSSEAAQIKEGPGRSYVVRRGRVHFEAHIPPALSPGGKTSCHSESPSLVNCGQGKSIASAFRSVSVWSIRRLRRHLRRRFRRHPYLNQQCVVETSLRS